VAQLTLRSLLVLLAAAGVAMFSLYFGDMPEVALLEATGRSWPRELREIAGIFGTFGAMLVITLVLGRLAGLNPLALGSRPGSSGIVGLFLGLILVVVAVGASFAVVSAVLIESVPMAAGLSPMIVATFAYLLVAVAEEALFRGWAQPLVARYWGALPAAFATAIIFAASHGLGLDKGASVINLFLGGLVMGLLAIRYGGIAAPIMFHFGWNWADYFLFALSPNPGRYSFGSVFDIDLFGAAQIWGVSDGLMANIFATLILVAMAAYLLLQLRSSAAGPQAKRKVVPKPATDQKSVAKAVAAVPDPKVDTPPQPLVSPPAEPAPAPALAPQAETVLNIEAMPTAEVEAGSESWVQTATHQGCVRELNEDRFLVRADPGIFVVADGMGGHKFGDRASTMIVEHVEAVVLAEGLDGKLAAVSDAVVAANKAIHAEAQTNGSRMGSTVVALLIDNTRYAIIWAGDSRAYRLRNGDVQRLTKDHTQVQEMVDRGLLQPEDVARHPMSHVLVRAVGVNPEIDLDVVQGDIESGDVYFLCSDGIYDVLEEDEIAALLTKSAKIDAMEKMISMALDLGARDNVTGIIVRPQLAG
jgi:serine/threonine protein phosphatase Stp1